MADAVDANAFALPTARNFPDSVPLLMDAEAGITLRAGKSSDLAAIVEQCRDPDMIRWTTVPNPPGGYQLRDAEEFLAVIANGWTSGKTTRLDDRGSARQHPRLLRQHRPAARGRRNR